MATLVSAENRRERMQRRYDARRRLLEEWFTPTRWQRVFPILATPNTDPDGVSLRELEYVTGEYACVYGVRYYIETPDGAARRFFDVHSAYLGYQGVNRKKFIEAFARSNREMHDGGRFEFGYGDDRCVTSVGQLNFMRFVLENEVLAWFRLHLIEVRARKVEYELRRRTVGDADGRRTRVYRRMVRRHQKHAASVGVRELRLETTTV